MPLKIFTEIRPSLGLRSLWWAVVTATVRPAASVTEFRDWNLLKILWRSVMPVMVCPVISSRSSESRFQYPNFRILSVLEQDPLDGPSWDPSTQTVITRINSTAQKWLNRSLQYIPIYPSFVLERSLEETQGRKGVPESVNRCGYFSCISASFSQVASSTGRFFHWTLMDAISLDLS